MFLFCHVYVSCLLIPHTSSLLHVLVFQPAITAGLLSPGLSRLDLPLFKLFELAEHDQARTATSLRLFDAPGLCQILHSPHWQLS